MYTIGEVSKKFNIPASTFRYYDKMGLFPNLDKSVANIRQFSHDDLLTIQTIECLKNSGLQIAEIKEYIQLCTEGNSILQKRQELFETSQKRVEEFVDVLDTNSLAPELKEVFDRYSNKEK